MPEVADELQQTSNRIGQIGKILIAVFAFVTTFGSITVFLVLNWITINKNADEIEELKKQHALHDLEEKVNRQYSLQRESEARIAKEMEVVKAWVEFHKGYIQAEQEYRKK